MKSVSLQDQASRPSPELAALLKEQAQLRALEKKLGSIERAMGEQNEKIAKVRAAVPSIQPNRDAHADLLAAEAAGHITAQERKEREAALATEFLKVSAAAADASAVVARVQATISGLDAQLRNGKAEIARAKRRCHEALDALLMGDAERLGQEYLELARGVYERFLQLRAIDGLHRQATGGEGGRYGKITGLDSEAFFLPAFRVGGHGADAVGNSKSRLFTEGGVYLDRPLEEATQRERARLEALGVALGWNGGRFRDGATDAAEPAEEERSAEAA